MTAVKDIMTKKVVTLREEMPLLEATGVLISRRISGAPVVDKENRLVGVLSQSDVVRALKRPLIAAKDSDELGRRYKGIDETTLVKDVLGFLSLDWLWYRWNMHEVNRIFKRLEESGVITKVRVKDAMTTSAHVVSVGPDDSTEDALRLMNANDVNRLPVMNPRTKKERLVGIVARADLLKSLSKELTKTTAAPKKKNTIGGAR